MSFLDCRYNDNSITKSKAIYVFTIGKYITECYRNFTRTGVYSFDNLFVDKLYFDKKQIERFNKKKQILLAQMRESLNSKQYFLFVFRFIRALRLSKSVL